jgi:hypothetical protein
MADAQAICDWYARERGISSDTLNAFGVFVRGDNVVMPYPNGEKERPDPTVQLPPEKRRFYFTPGRAPGRVPALYQPPVQPDGDTAFLCEGETDTMRLWQELQGTYPVYGLGGINTWTPEAAATLSRYARVWVCLDNDTDYRVAPQVDAAWRTIRGDLGGRARRIHLPNGVKDVCEFFGAGYDAASLKALTERVGTSRYKPIDFTQPPPQVNWLVEGWIARGDVVILAGLGGLGKSMLTMDLSTSVINGEAEWLGIPLHAGGRVLYVDEENPIDVIHSRLRRLGLDPAAHLGQLRYLWQQGIRLDKDPDTLIDEGLDYQPALTVIDSLTRVHGQEEKDAGAIAPLFNDAIKPLARETNSAVIVLHHHDKGANGPRGSTDIFNAADTVIEVYDQGAVTPGKFLMRLTKSRRSKRGQELRVQIVDRDDGTMALVPDALPNLVF